MKRLPAEYKPIDEISDLWNVLSPTQINYLREHCTVRHLKKNELIHKEGDKPAYLFCLVEGKIKFTKKGPGGRVQIVRMIKPVSYMGYRAIFAENSYTTAGMAVEPSVVYIIDADAFRQLVFNCAKLSRYFLEQLSLDLGGADSRVISLTQKHVRGRIAEAICFLIDNYGYELDGVTLAIYLSREDLASLSNMTVSNAIRTLALLVNQKLITTDGRVIKIMNEEGLRHISKFG